MVRAARGGKLADPHTHALTHTVRAPRAGGARERFCSSVATLAQWTDADMAVGHKAPVDDESYINALNYRFPPSRVMTVAYMHPDLRINAPVRAPRRSHRAAAPRGAPTPCHATRHRRHRAQNHPWAWDFFHEDKQHDKFPAKVLNVPKDKYALIS